MKILVLSAASSLSLILLIGASTRMVSGEASIFTHSRESNVLTSKNIQQTMRNAMRRRTSPDECSKQQQTIDESGANDLDTPEGDDVPDFCHVSEDGDQVVICDYDKIGATLDAEKCKSLGGSIVAISLTLQCENLLMGLQNAPACLSDICNVDQVEEEYAALWNDDKESCDIDVFISASSFMKLHIGILSFTMLYMASM